MALDVSTFVQINTRVSAGGVPRPDFGRGLLVTVDDTLPAGGSGKIQAFADINGINTAFASGSPRSDAATWFGADPPPRPLYIGRWANADVSTTLLGAAPAAVGDLSAANSTFVLNGTTVTVNLSTGATYSDKAALIQTAVQGSFSGATFTYDASGFLLTLAGAGEIEGGALANTAVGGDTDLAPLLGMDSDSRPDLQAGLRSGNDRGSHRDDGGTGWRFAAGRADARLRRAGTGQRRQLAAVRCRVGAGGRLRRRDPRHFRAGAGRRRRDFPLGAGVRATAVAGGGRLLQGEHAPRHRADGADVRAEPRPALERGFPARQGASGRALPSDVTFTQLGELERKRVNVYTNVGGLPSLVGGYAANSSYWLDASWWLLWMKSRLETAIWSSLRGSNRLTNAILQDTISNAAEAGVRNGGIQPGRRVDNATKSDIIRTTGNVEFSGVLTTGWLLWIESDSEQSDADRAARHGRFKLYVSGSERPSTASRAAWCFRARQEISEWRSFYRTHTLTPG